MNPLFAVLVLCPIIAVVLGICSFFVKWFRLWGALIISFMLPLLYIASNLSTWRGNLDAWFIYGAGYILLTWIVYRLLRAIVGYKT
ncbi:apolipoprotein N-acyltransferase [Paenibacillus sp. W4I10]|uniref:hypothetical protein n=1 Tax=Paenibacillus sp. W4I10 TaxID=3042298 RepID=UPI002784C126|nr:hypothetical protein [Paenibacillus sp. W4I10]MDQ0722580.1 apolipoprotein N-acyltransferase [Paenibacillus sp. W4I10]